MKKINVLILFVSIVVITSYLYGFTISKIIVAGIAYFAYLKKDSWIDKAINDEWNKKD